MFQFAFGYVNTDFGRERSMHETHLTSLIRYQQFAGLSNSMRLSPSTGPHFQFIPKIDR